MTRRIEAVLALALALGGCSEDPSPPDGPVHECAEAWGDLADPQPIYVDAAAEEGGDGSADAPFAWLDRHELITRDDQLVDPVDSGLEEARRSGSRSIAVAPGDYPVAMNLSNDDVQRSDSNLEIAGCGRERTVLSGVTEEVAPGGRDDVLQSVVRVAGSSTADVVIRDLTVSGGRRGVVIRDGAGSTGAIRIERVDVLDSVRLGVVIDNGGTVAELCDVAIRDVLPEDGEFGWGLSVQAGVFFPEDAPAPVLLDGVEVSGAHGIGVLVDGSWIDTSGLSVADTSPIGDQLGRGVQVQNRTWGVMRGVEVSGSADAAMYLHMPGRVVDSELSPIQIVGGSFGSTDWADVGDGNTAADGLSASQSHAGYPATDFLVVIDDATFEDNPRTHVLAEGVSVEIGTSTIFGDGTTFPIAAQDGALVTAGEPVEELGPDAELPLNRAALDVDDLTD